MAYNPIAAYGVIGNDDRIALIDRSGSIDWCCFPHVAGESVFAAILDTESGGHFSLRPTARYRSEQSYRGRSNVLETDFETASGQLSVTDFMPVGTSDASGSIQQTICRRVRCTGGPVVLEVEFKPRLDYARVTTTLEAEDGTIVAKQEATSDTQSEEEAEGKKEAEEQEEKERLHLQLVGDVRLTTHADRAVGATTIQPNETVWFVLQHGYREPVFEADCQQLLDETTDYWQEWVESIQARARAFAGGEPWFDALVRSGLTLKLLINEGSGAIYAAPTTSLPEWYGGERNWDYRYNWMRDAKFTVQALYNLGAEREAHQYFEWFRNIAHEQPEDIQPVYGVHGERDIEEFELDQLAGYRYSSPVRVGNAAAPQRQLDTFGTIVQGLYETLLHDEHIDEDDWTSITRLVDHVCEVWAETGAGIWEYRDEQHHYVHSKLLCWVALDRGIELADHYHDDIDVSEWEREREAIREAIETRGYSESAGSFVQHFDTDSILDAAVLLLPIYEFLPPDDPRVEATIDTLMDELMTDDGLVYRTKGTGKDEEERGAFLICTFWLVDALVLADRSEEAREIFTTVLEAVEEPFLLPERLYPATGEFLGNYPQAFSHIGLINSAVYLSSASDTGELGHDPQESADVEPLFRS